MRRRQFITSASATVAAASMAGCSGILGGGGGSSGPAAPVKTYLKAGVEGDQKKIQKALHPDASQEMTTAAGFLSMADSINIKNTKVVEKSDGEASVEVTYEITAMGETSSNTATFFVRKHKGDWKVYGGE